MTVILGVVLAAIILILFAPLRLILSFENSDFRAKVVLAGIPVYTYKGKKDKKSIDEAVEDRVKLLEKDTLSLGEKIKGLVGASRLAARLLGKYTSIKNFSLKLLIGTGDAATTAVSVGLSWAAIYNLLGIVGRIVYIDNHSVEISPDYSGQVFSAEGKCIIKSRIVYIIIIAITILLKIKSRNHPSMEKGKED